MATAVTTSGARYTETDGTNAYSSTSGFILKPASSRPIAEVIAEPLRPFAVTLYPNPASDVTRLSINNPSGSNVMIHLFDVSGKKIAVFNGGKATTNNISLPLQTLKAGTYWVEVRTDKESKTLQMIVNK